MSISLEEDIKTIEELSKHALDIVKQVRTTGRPVVVTRNGKPDVVVIDAAMFEKKLKLANLAHLISEAEQDIRDGKTRSASAFLKELLDQSSFRGI